MVLGAAGLHLLAREGNNAAATAKLKALSQAVERQEPRNPALWLRLAQPYARLAGALLTVPNDGSYVVADVMYHHQSALQHFTLQY